MTDVELTVYLFWAFLALGFVGMIYLAMRDSRRRK